MRTVQRIGNWCAKGFDLIVNSMYYFAAALLLFLAVSVGYSVIMRRFFDSPVGWVFDNGGHMLFFIAFLSSTKILKDNGHARMTLVLERVGLRTTLWLNGVTALFGSVICVIAFWYTGDAVVAAIQENQVYREVNFPIHRAVLWWIMPAGFLMMAVQFLRMSFENGNKLFNREGDLGNSGHDLMTSDSTQTET